jgi:hypothetical protein
MKTIILILFLLGMAILVGYLYPEPDHDSYTSQLETELRHNQSRQPFYIGNIHVTPSYEPGVFIFRVPKKSISYCGAGDNTLQGKR